MSLQRPIIGNQGAQIRSFQQGSPTLPEGGYYPSPYPQGYGGFAPQQAQQAQGTSGGLFGGLSSFLGGGTGTAGGGSSFNIGQIKQMIDRLGGIEGIMDTMTKVQRMVQGFQQMAPLIKVMMNSFGKGKKDDLKGLAPARRKRRRRRSVSGKGGLKRRTDR